MTENYLLMNVPREISDGLREIARKKGISINKAVDEILCFSDDPSIAAALAFEANEPFFVDSLIRDKKTVKILDKKIMKTYVKIILEGDGASSLTTISRLQGETIAQSLTRCLMAYSTKDESLTKFSPFKLDFAVLYSGRIHEEEKHLSISSFCEALTTKGIKAGVLGNQGSYSKGELVRNVSDLPKIVLIDWLQDYLKPYVLFLERNCRVINPLNVIEVGRNRFYCWIELEKLDVNKPKTWFLDSMDKLVVFIQEAKTPLAIKEWRHRGGGTTVVKVEKWSDALLPTLRRFDMAYPAVVQEWLPHDPEKEYMRIINVGGTAMGSVPNEVTDSITHGQEAISYKKCRVPKSVESMTTKILDFWGAGYASFDIVKSCRKYYVMDMHFNMTDLFDQFELSPRRFINAWIKLMEME